MTVELQLPNPQEMSFEGFIKQMQTIIKALEKSYENVKSEVPEEKWNDISFYFNTQCLEKISADDARREKKESVEDYIYEDAYDDSQVIKVVISY